MGTLDDAVYGKDAAPLIQSLIEGKELLKWQQHFCDNANVFACCTDSQGTALTEFGGNKNEAARIKKIIDHEQLQNMLCRVAGSALEDQAIETTAYPNLRLAVISAKIEGKPVINWFVYGVLSDADNVDEYENPPLEEFTSTITEKQFEKVVAALRDVTDTLLGYKLATVNAQAESNRSRYSEKEMEENLRRSEALTAVVQLLESEDAIESVLQKLLGTTGEFLKLSFTALYREAKDQKHLDMIAQWHDRSLERVPLDTMDDKCSAFFRVDKTLVLSYNSMMKEEEKEQMKAMGLKAVIVMPVVISGVVRMYACFGERVKDRVWKLEDIKFLNDSVKILQSILTKRIQKNSLADSYASMEAILDNVGSAVYVRDIETGKVLFSNRNMRHAFGAELEDGTLNLFLDGVIQRESGISEIHLHRREQWYDLYYTHMKWVDGRQVLLCALYDVTEKKIYQRKMEQQASTDFLTGLYNRMFCERDLTQYVDKANKVGGKGALLYLDIDDFKHINDGLGHQYGDVLLKSISSSLQSIKGIENTCYRMGGDEFVIIISPDKHDRMEQIITSIKEVFLKPWFLKEDDYYCTMSMGIVEFPTDDDAANDLIKKADIAMYEAKKGGKNRIVHYTDSFGIKSGKRLDMEKNMRDASAKGYHEFEVYYQPIIDIQKDGLPCTGAEALIRWNSAELGFISPAEFIPLAEYLGLINPIGNYVLREACKTCKNWNDNGYPDYKVNVNLSVVQLLQPDIVESIEKIIKETGIKSCNLTLEVTESLAINDMGRMKEILARIRALGVRIALDDFGTGYSSLNHIREIPLDVIKVDQSFIKDLERDSYAKSFIKMVGDLATTIGVNLCVEGVETKKQYKILSEICDCMVQGYYFDRPMPRELFEKKYTPNIFPL